VRQRRDVFPLREAGTVRSHQGVFSDRYEPRLRNSAPALKDT
jgi:hypothetical protein